MEVTERPRLSCSKCGRHFVAAARNGYKRHIKHCARDLMSTATAEERSLLGRWRILDGVHGVRGEIKFLPNGKFIFKNDQPLLTPHGGCHCSVVRKQMVRESESHSWAKVEDRVHLKGLGTDKKRCCCGGGFASQELDFDVSISLSYLVRNAETKNCFACGEVGHLVSHCPRKDEPRRCWSCGQEGHEARECTETK